MGFWTSWAPSQRFQVSSATYRTWEHLLWGRNQTFILPTGPKDHGKTWESTHCLTQSSLQLLLDSGLLFVTSFSPKSHGHQELGRGFFLSHPPGLWHIRLQWYVEAPTQLRHTTPGATLHYRYWGIENFNVWKNFGKQNYPAHQNSCSVLCVPVFATVRR